MEQLNFVMEQYGIKRLKEEKYELIYFIKNYFESLGESSLNELTESELRRLPGKLLMSFTRNASNPLVIANIQLFKKRNGGSKAIDALPDPLLKRMRFDYVELRKGVKTVMTTSTGLHSYGLSETLGAEAEEVIDFVFQNLTEVDRIKGTFYESEKSMLVENQLKKLLNEAYNDLNDGPAISHMTKELLAASERIIKGAI